MTVPSTEWHLILSNGICSSHECDKRTDRQTAVTSVSIARQPKLINPCFCIVFYMYNGTMICERIGLLH